MAKINFIIENDDGSIIGGQGILDKCSLNFESDATAPFHPIMVADCHLEISDFDADVQKNGAYIVLYQNYFNELKQLKAVNAALEQTIKEYEDGNG